MAAVDFVAVPNNSAYVTFDDLHLGRSSQEVICRLLRFWDSKNIKKNGKFMGITLLFLDEKNTLVYGFIPPIIVDFFRPVLREGLIFKIGSFEVGRCNKMYKITDSPFVLRFLQRTTFEPVESVLSINRYKFMIRKLDQLQALANTNLELPDVIGQIRFVQDSNLNEPTSTQRLVIRFHVHKDITVYLSLRDDAAATFRAHMCSGNQLHSVMIVTTVNPKLFGSNLYLNSTAATRFYFETGINAIQQFKESMGINGDIGDFTRADTTDSLAKMETVSIKELQAYISRPAEETQDADFLCKATIVSVLQSNGWSYISCRACSRKLDRSETALRCNKCVTSRTTGIVRYRVELDVKDNEGRATFVVFDTEMTKQTAKTAATLTLEVADEDQRDLPHCLGALAGKTFMFKIRVSPFNFTANHRTFTVTTMTEEPAEENLLQVDDPQQAPLQLLQRPETENANVVHQPTVPVGGETTSTLTKDKAESSTKVDDQNMIANDGGNSRKRVRE